MIPEKRTSLPLQQARMFMRVVTDEGYVIDFSGFCDRIDLDSYTHPFGRHHIAEDPIGNIRLFGLDATAFVISEPGASTDRHLVGDSLPMREDIYPILNP